MASSAPLGVKLRGSAKTGHRIEVLREGGLRDVFRTADRDQALALLSHCLKVLAPGEAGGDGEAEDERHFRLSIINDLGPRDAVERMLAVQMAATHVALVRSGRGMATASHLPQLEAHTTAYNKLARTFAAQVEALRKHRTGGKQTVVVQHVTVADGGQAIVGHVETGGRGSHER